MIVFPAALIGLDDPEASLRGYAFVASKDNLNSTCIVFTLPFAERDIIWNIIAAARSRRRRSCAH